MDTARLWHFLPLGYLLTVAIETPVLLVGLAPRHPARRRLLAGLWLTACTYPVVVLVLPVIFDGASRAAYILTAEVFAPAAECALFLTAFPSRKDDARPSRLRDCAAITAANLASFAAGELLAARGWLT
ncbi:MAG TPA: hypothetical protein VK422_16145 [Pyrinomonadaceae bacterium]|nr:hypothetical protein [Pyrinomonadaceae bacterium]